MGQMIVTSLYFFPQILSATVFSVYIGTNHILDISTAFTVMTILNLLQEPLRTLPLFLGQLIEFLIAMRRIQAFINLDEINPTIVSKLDRETAESSIEIWKGNFHWGAKTHLTETRAAELEPENLDSDVKVKDFMSIKDMNLKIKQGEFVCIIGDVGSGKSSLLSSVIGDLLYANPTFMVANGEEPTTHEMKKALVNHS
jgi:ATP-binding cassette subfamily C (CFTR/MRP) protein 1